MVDGLVLLEEIAARLGFEPPQHESSTLGGFVIARLGRIARIGDLVRVGRLHGESHRDERGAA